MWVAGLTGGIASGKSTVAELFAARGVVIVDTDDLAREVVEPGTPGLAEVTATFGTGILTASGDLDRAALRRQIFADPAARERLEALLHPQIERLALTRIAAARGPYALLVVPLLIEKHWHRRVDRVLLVDVPYAQQVARLRHRDHMDDASARAAIDAQADRATRLAAADDVIDNRGSPRELGGSVDTLHLRYLAFSGAV